MIAFMTASIGAKHTKAVNDFFEAADKYQWVVIAADGATDERLPSYIATKITLKTGLEAMEKSWPGAKDWDYAVGGFSGGGKYAGYMSTYVVKEGYRLIGVLMAGVNSDLTKKGIKQEKPSRGIYKRALLFQSNGDKDKVAKMASADRVFKSAKSNFRDSRFEVFDGGHRFHKPHILEAFRWFTETLPQ